MGCDIHLFIQYKRKTEIRWNDFGGRIRVERDYNLFGLLAHGVRTFPDPEGYAVKGIPADLEKYHAPWKEFFDYIDDPEEPNNITQEQAESYGREIYNDEYSKWTENTDIHSHSYLSLEEYQKAIQRRRLLDYGIDTAYLAVGSAMETLRDRYEDVRVVFGFDN